MNKITLEFHWQQRFKIIEIKRRLTNEYQSGRDINSILQEFKEFNQKIETDLYNFRKSQINLINEKETNKKFLNIFEEDKEFLRSYYDVVHLTRPNMIKQEDSEFDWDWDFEVDRDNYDPWTEYKMIYRDLFTKGKAYWIIKSMPDWKFLQVGQINSDEDISTNQYNPKRANMNDSIFNMMMTDRYFEERSSKRGIAKGKSQSVRI